MQECTELLQSTTFFDSEGQRTSFFEAVNHALQNILATLEAWADHDKLLKDVFERSEAKRSSETRASFVPNMNSWDQFLNPGAPGVQGVAADTHRNKSMRLIPPAGAAILAHWNEDIRALSTNTNPPVGCLRWWHATTQLIHSSPACRKLSTSVLKKVTAGRWPRYVSFLS